MRDEGCEIVDETAFQEERSWFHRIFDTSSEPAWMIEGNRFIECNEAAALTLGYPNSQALLDLHPSRLSPPEQPDGLDSFVKAEQMMAMAQSKGFHCFEWLHRKADGSDVMVEVTLSCVSFKNQPVLLCVWKDLSARQAQELQIRGLLEEQRLIFDNAHVGILLLCKRKIIKCNAHIAEMFGCTSVQELEGHTTRDFYTSDADFDAVGREAYSQLKNRGFASFETEMLTRNGERLWVVQSGRPLDPDRVLDAPSIWVYTDITDHKKAELARQQSEEKFVTAFESCPLPASISTIADGSFLAVNTAYKRHFGWIHEDLVGRTSVEIGFWPDTNTREDWLSQLMQAGRVLDYETTWLDKSGTRRPVSISSEIIQLDGQSCILVYVTDISARKESEARLRIAAAAFESQECIIVTDDRGMILQVNRAFMENTGYTEAEVIGQTPRILRSGRHDADFYRTMWDDIRRYGGWQGEVWDRRKNGEIYPKWLTISAVKDDSGQTTHYVGTHYDITERKLAEERINALAFYDQLTGLPNRTLLLDRLHQTLAAATRNRRCGALLFLDLDNFKTLNDTQGHDLGDLLLKEVAARLKDSIREEDTASRLGGDEFVVVLSELGSTLRSAGSGAEAVACKLLESLSQPYQIGTLDYRCSASIGVTLFDATATSPEDLMKQADMALYRAKAAGRNVVRFFDPAMETAVQAQASLERDLRSAVELQQFILHYQPQVTGDGQVVGAEALVRWQHPERGMVSPAAFIPLAEETGIILDLGLWVLKTACQRLAMWATQPELAQLVLAVNVSALQFHTPDFVEQVIAVLKETGADPQRLKLELTESMLVEDLDGLIGKMHRLQALGIGFSLDDFGTGFSSLSFLKRLPLDQLKIDQSFVRDVLTDANDAAIARTIVALAQSLGMAVIAEGVETREQQAFLAQHGCMAYQGYLFSRPLPVEAFEQFVQASLSIQ